MRKIGKLLPGAVIAAFLLVCAASFLTGSGKEPPEVRTRQTPQSTAVSVPVRSVDVKTGLINVNTADLETLMTLPGIGEVRAERIIEYREANGPFLHMSDLLSVKGIGQGILENIRDLICLEDDNENTDH